MQTHLYQWEGQVDGSQVFYRHQELCETLGGNPVPLLTITSQPRSSQRQDVEEFCESFTQGMVICSKHKQHTDELNHIHRYLSLIHI